MGLIVWAYGSINEMGWVTPLLSPLVKSPGACTVVNREIPALNNMSWYWMSDSAKLRQFLVVTFSMINQSVLIKRDGSAIR